MSTTRFSIPVSIKVCIFSISRSLSETIQPYLRGFKNCFNIWKKIDTRKTETYSAYPNSFWNILNTIDIVIIGSIWKLPSENEVDTPKNVIGKLLMAGIVFS